MLHWSPMWGSLGTTQHWQCEVQHCQCWVVPNCWGPGEDGSGGEITTMGNRLLLVTPAISLEQPETQPCLCQIGQQPKANAPEERWGIEPHRLVEGGPTEVCSRPSNELHHGIAANPLPSPSRQCGNSHTQTHVCQSATHTRAQYVHIPSV